MKEKLQEIYKGLTERLKSPFIITFILVWSIRHWQLLFILFTFDENRSQAGKFTYAYEYVHEHGFKWMFWVPLGCTILSFLGYIIAALFFESLTEAYERWGRPGIYYLINRNKIVKKEDYLKLERDFKRVSEKNSTLEMKLIKVSEENDAIKAIQESKDEKIESLESDNLIVRRELEQYKSKSHKDENFIYNSTRTGMFTLLDYFSHKPNNKLVPIKLQTVLLGAWKRTEYDASRDPISKVSEKELLINDENVISDKGDFVFKVDKISQYENKNIFILEYTNQDNLQVKEILFKVTKDLYIGRNMEHIFTRYNFVEYFKT